MDENNATRLRKFIAAISDPVVSDLLDRERLFKSGMYGAALEMAVEHAIKHKDYGFINGLLVPLGDSSYARDLVGKIRPRLSFVVYEKKPYRLRQASKAQADKIAKKTTDELLSMNIDGKSSSKIAKMSMPESAKIPEVKRAKRRKKLPVVKISEDLMDSRLMLPGSYGTGKKR